MAGSPCILCDIRVPHDPRLCHSWGVRGLAAYGIATPDPGRARMAWRDVVRIGCDHPALALCVGASIGSVLLEALGGETFVLRIVGEAHSGKTMALRTAMAAVGQPESLVRPASVVRSDVAESLEELSILPVAFDDLEGSHIDVVRTTLREDGRSSRMPRWRLIVLAAGSEPGIGAGLTEAERPHLVELPWQVPANALSEIHALATTHPGWPLRRLPAHPVLGEAREWYEPILRTLEGGASTTQARTVARHLAVSAVGFGLLGRLVGHGLAAYAGVGAALEMVSEGRSSGGPTDVDQRNRSVSEGRTRSVAPPAPGCQG